MLMHSCNKVISNPCVKHSITFIGEYVNEVISHESAYEYRHLTTRLLRFARNDILLSSRGVYDAAI